jgi:hypothetical protein
LVALALLLGLLYGGRWTFNRIRGDSSDTAAVRAALSGLGTQSRGQVAVAADSVMQTGRTFPVLIAVYGDTDQQILRAIDTGKAITRQTDVTVSPFMRADLSGANFKIERRSEQNQTLEPSMVTTWWFDVTPLESGPQILTAHVSRRYKAPGGDETHELPAATLRVRVRVNAWSAFTAFLDSLWTKIGGAALILALFTWWLAMRRDRTPTAPATQPEPPRSPPALPE